ncbi:MAG: bifunctional phosphopantothenoylcysteine decarboxylase/phosphopantothenate--cysteine ligase CoaBC [Bdellovibrionales bacterium]|nr:bifunctional phosphopantothenoylcysteine decarboxylase/phosphopantothenate--cysteine ligase CoaBC [Bdellovibrionales bacterium]
MLNSDSASGRNVLLLVSGSIAAFKAVALASSLKKAGYCVKTALTENATHFVGPASFEGITGEKTFLQNFDAGSMMAHIHLERWADLILFYPASAESIANLASGSGRNLPAAIFLAHEFKKPFLIAPAMNQAMWKHPALKRNLETMKAYGIEILPPSAGTLACGETGEGRLLEPEEAIRIIQERLEVSDIKNAPLKPRILITAGGTSEPIDEVRHLRNLSSGRTGHHLALSLQNAGYPVTLLQSEYSFAREGIRSLMLFSTTRDFAEKLKHELETNVYDYVVHSAAVADYHVSEVTDSTGRPMKTSGKIQTNVPLVLKLLPNPKIIRELRTWSMNKNLKIISFKLTSDESTDLKLESYDSEWIIHNHLKDVGLDSHKGQIFKKTADHRYLPQSRFRTKAELDASVLKILETNSGETQ